MKTYCDKCGQDDPEVVVVGHDWLCEDCYNLWRAMRLEKFGSKLPSFEELKDLRDYDGGIEPDGQD